MENGKLKRMKDALPEEGVLKKPLTRRGFLAGAGATSFALLLAACGGGGSDETTAAPTTEAEPPPETGGADTSQVVTTTPGEAPLHEGLAEGMYGGPTGWTGAERYQYPLDSEEGRAISALRQMRQDGTAPDTLIVQTLNFSRPQFENPWPEGAISHVQLFEEETGIKIEFIETDPASEYQDNLKNASTKNGSFDIVTSAIEEIGDFAEAGLIRPIDEFVEKYQPQWTDPEWGFAGGETTVNLFSKYKDTYYMVAFDNDTQPYYYRSDLLENPDEQAAFEDQYGRPLEFPLTWEHHDEVAAFFTRPDAEVPLFGDANTLAPFWGAVKWNERFISAANPNNSYFNDDGSANVNTDAGVRAFQELLDSLKNKPPGGMLEKDWIGQYQVMGGGNGFMGGSFANMTKLVPGNPAYDTANVGQYIKSDVTPGRDIDGALIRRPVIFYNICYGVNAFSDPAHHEAAYLFLQWAGGARIYTWLCFNLGGYQDPHHIYTLNDPNMAVSYKPQPLGSLANIVPRSAPPITIKGGGAYRDTLSEELQKLLTKQQSPEQAAKSLQDRWDKITDDNGVDTLVAALPSFATAFPTVVDTPGTQLEVTEVSTEGAAFSLEELLAGLGG
ncbi:MAG: extracellular solute-binding protein [Gaiellales bacterium]